ncbi:MAG: TorF family putative porin [Woeseiaceae bacterium]
MHDRFLRFPVIEPGKGISCTRRLRAAVLLLATVAAAPAHLFAAQFTGYASLTTDYVYRGVTRSDGHGAIQLGGDISFDAGFYAGIWGSTVDIGNNVTRQRDTEVNYYLGYSYQASDRWTIGGNVVSYQFPGAFGALDYDHEEYAVTLNYNDQWWFEYAQAPDYYGAGVRAHNYELFTEWPLPHQVSLSVGIGHFDVGDFSGDSYTFWQLGASRPLGPLDIDLRYHDTSNWVPRVSSPERADARFVLTARFQF